MFPFYFGISHLFVYLFFYYLGCLSVLKLAPAECATNAFNSKYGSRSPDNAEFGHFMHVAVFQRTAKKCTKNYNARA